MPFCGRSFGGGGLVLLRPSSAAAAGGLPEAVAVAVHSEDADVMGETIEQRAGEALRAQNLCPVLERKVGCHDRRSAFVTLGEGLEQQFGARGRERDVAQFIDDEQLPHLPRMEVKTTRAADYAALIPGMAA